MSPMHVVLATRVILTVRAAPAARATLVIPDVHAMRVLFVTHAP